MLNATLKKLNVTLSDIDDLETEQQNLEDRLTDVRQSMRKYSGGGSSSVRQPNNISYHTKYIDISYLISVLRFGAAL